MCLFDVNIYLLLGGNTTREFRRLLKLEYRLPLCLTFHVVRVDTRSRSEGKSVFTLLVCPLTLDRGKGINYI